MIKRLVAGGKQFFGLHYPGRNLRVFPDDVFLVSYPKSGNTWTRFLIANLIYPEKHPDFSNINVLVPDPEGLTKRHLEQLPRPRYLKSHAYFDHRYPKVIHIVRDPRDVVLSEYYFDIKRRAIADDFPLDKFVSRFVSGELNHPYGTWGENTATWFYARGNSPRLLLVTYESLQSEGARQLARIAEFIGVPVTTERINFAIEQSSADRMRELEKKQGHLWSSTKQTRQDKPFVRAAKAGGWKNELSEASIAEIESAWGGLMHELGYELASGAAPVSSGVSSQVSSHDQTRTTKVGGEQSFAGTRSK
ncbi:MAG: sulfotransferase domain-containing protein [Terriglobales bacterium]